MEQDPAETVSMLRFILAYFAVKLAAAGALTFYALNVDGEPPVSATVIMIVAIGIAVFWFAKKVNRPMLRSEMMRFAIGNTVVELILTITWSFSMIWLTDASFSWGGLSQVLGGVDQENIKVILAVALSVGLLPVPILSAFFGWLMTKNLARASSANK